MLLPPDFVWICRPHAAPTVDDLATAWLEHAATIYAGYLDDLDSISEEELRALQERPRPIDESDTSAAVHDLSHTHPDETIAFVRSVLAAKPSPVIVGYLAAGSLEEVLSFHGNAVIDRVEAWAHQDPVFRECLSGVWQFYMTDDIWFRVCKAVGRPPVSMNDPEDDDA